MKIPNDYLNANFMDFVDMPKPDVQRKNKKFVAERQSPFTTGDFMAEAGYNNIGLDFGKIANQGLHLNSGLELGISSPISHKEWGFEDYVARDFNAPRAFTQYGKESKKDRAMRSVSADENEIFYGMESIGIAGGKSVGNISKARKSLAIKNMSRKVRRGERMEFSEYSNEAKTRKQKEQQATQEYVPEKNKWGIEPDVSETNTVGNYEREQNAIVLKRGPVSRKYTKYGGKHKGRHYFFSKVKQEYFPD